MTFPPEISMVFRVIVSLALAFGILYYFDEDLSRPDSFYFILLKIAVCFTAVISYLNDREQMLRITSRGVTIEDIDFTPKLTKVSFLYVVIVIAYNPVYPLFYSPALWVISDAVTVLFFLLKIEKKKK